MQSVRKSNVELLRILTMCGVILLHYNGIYGKALDLVVPGTANYWILMALESVCICAVNVFLLISGYFSCTSQRRSPAKAVLLLLQVVIFQLGFYLLGVIRGGGFSWADALSNLLPVNYFAVLYVVLLFIGPYINILLKSLTKKQLTSLLVSLLVLFSLLPTATDLLEVVTNRPFTGLNTVGLGGDGYGYTIVNFVLMYFVGACIRLFPATDCKCWKLLSALAVCTGLIVLLSLYHPGIARSYCNPLVILSAVLVFLLFLKLSIQSAVINRLSKGAFTVFLFHGFLVSRLNVERAVGSSWWYLLCHILIACIGVYLVSWVVYEVYTFIMKPISKCLEKVLPPKDV